MKIIKKIKELIKRTPDKITEKDIHHILNIPVDLRKLAASGFCELTHVINTRKPHYTDESTYDRSTEYYLN